MMTEHEPFLHHSKQVSRWKSWDVLFYVMLLIPLALLFVFGQVVILGNRPAKQILIPFNNHSHSLGFPMTTKTPLAPFTYSQLPSCSTITLKVNTTTQWRTMNTCQFALLQRFFNNEKGILPNFASVLYVCDDSHELEGIEIREFVSYRRPYYVVMPKCKGDDPITLISIGFDQDAIAENQLKQSIDNLKIYGTSLQNSKSTSNTKIFEKIFPHAISESDGNLELSVSDTETSKNHTLINVKSIGFSNFMHLEFKNQTFFDIIWINLENGPFEYWKFVGKDQIFDKLGLTFCQIGLEVRSDQDNEFYGFMLNVLNNPKYLFVRPSMSVDEKFVRFVLLNVVDERCYKKYVQ